MKVICASMTASMARGVAAKRTLRGVIFDMDGTLTVPVIDFAKMRQRVGVTTGDILDVISRWPSAKQKEAFRAIAEIEEQALADLQVMPGAVELCSFIDEKGLPRGMITRNVKSSVDFFHAHHFPLPPFWPALSRECHLYKPSPAPLLHICQQWGINPQEVVIIGDSAKDDIVCGNRAGAYSVLLDTTGQYQEGQLVGELLPTFKVTSLLEVRALFDSAFELVPPDPQEAVASTGHAPSL